MAAALTKDDHIHRLALTCELDRLRLRLAMRPARQGEHSIASIPLDTLNRAFSFTQFLPGKLGRLSRTIALGSYVFNIVRPLVRAFT